MVLELRQEIAIRGVMRICNTLETKILKECADLHADW